MDHVQHQQHEAAAPAHGVQLRLVARDRHLRSRVLPLESVVLSEDAGAWPGLSQAGAGELVSGVRHRTRERTSCEWLLLASRIDAGGAARYRAVVPAHH